MVTFCFFLKCHPTVYRKIPRKGSLFSEFSHSHMCSKLNSSTVVHWLKRLYIFPVYIYIYIPTFLHACACTLVFLLVQCSLFCSSDNVQEFLFGDILSPFSCSGCILSTKMVKCFIPVSSETHNSSHSTCGHLSLGLDYLATKQRSIDFFIGSFRKLIVQKYNFKIPMLIIYKDLKGYF